jgi:hypothetical protein
VFVQCGVRQRQKGYAFLEPCLPPTRREPTVRQNPFPPGTCRWAACEAINRMDGEFREADVEIGYRAACRLSKIFPRGVAKNIRTAVTLLVKRGVLIRVGGYHSGKVMHGTQR